MISIKRTLFTGIFYTAIARYSAIVISLFVTAVLSRLLSPEDFGIVAIATVIINFFSIFTDIGISPAIIQNKNLTKKDISALFSFTIWSGIVISLIFFLLSWVISEWYTSSILKPLCQLLAINLFFSSANIIPNALFYKNKQFKYIAWRSFIIQISGGVLAVGFALLGGGLYSLIISPIISSILLFLISFHKYPIKIHLTLGIDTLKKIFNYSVYQFLFNIINYFSRNLDKLLIGRYLPMSLLGYYEKSYRLMMLPLQNITYVITPVMHPVLSDFQNDIERLSTSYEKIVRLLAYIGFPLSILFLYSSKEITLIIFGDKWMPSVETLKILSLTIGIQMILSSSGAIYQAAGDTKSLFNCGLFSSITNVAGMLASIFIFGTLKSIAISICITFSLNFLQCYLVMYKVTFQERSFLIFIKQLISPISLSIIIAFFLHHISAYTEHLSLLYSLCIKCCFFLISIGLYLQLTNEYDLIKKIKGKKI